MVLQKKYKNVSRSRIIKVKDSLLATKTLMGSSVNVFFIYVRRMKNNKIYLMSTLICKSYSQFHTKDPHCSKVVLFISYHFFLQYLLSYANIHI